MADHLQRIELFSTARSATSYFGGRSVSVMWIKNITKRAFISKIKFQTKKHQTKELIQTWSKLKYDMKKFWVDKVNFFSIRTLFSLI